MLQLPRLNEKGQEYSAFKLLIAAIVALAILMILIGIIQQIVIGTEKEPNQTAKEQVNNLYNKPETVNTTDAVAFKENTVLTAATIVAGPPLSVEQICLSLGKFEGKEDDFELTTDPHHRILWKGTQKKTVKLMVTCNNDLASLKEYVDTINGGAFSGWANNCDICEGQGRCCLVALTTD